jgi:hypothetical protein
MMSFWLFTVSILPTFGCFIAKNCGSGQRVGFGSFFRVIPLILAEVVLKKWSPADKEAARGYILTAAAKPQNHLLCAAFVRTSSAVVADIYFRCTLFDL